MECGLRKIGFFRAAFEGMMNVMGRGETISNCLILFSGPGFNPWCRLKWPLQLNDESLVLENKYYIYDWSLIIESNEWLEITRILFFKYSKLTLGDRPGRHFGRTFDRQEIFLFKDLCQVTSATCLQPESELRLENVAGICISNFDFDYRLYRLFARTIS